RPRWAEGINGTRAHVPTEHRYKSLPGYTPDINRTNANYNTDVREMWNNSIPPLIRAIFKQAKEGPGQLEAFKLTILEPCQHIVSALEKLAKPQLKALLER